MLGQNLVPRKNVFLGAKCSPNDFAVETFFPGNWDTGEREEKKERKEREALFHVRAKRDLDLRSIAFSGHVLEKIPGLPEPLPKFASRFRDAGMGVVEVWCNVAILAGTPPLLHRSTVRLQ